VAQSRRFGRSRFTLILLVLASLTVLTLDYRDTGPVQGIRSVFGTVFSPFEGIGNAIASPFENGWKGIFEYDDLEDENRDLQRRVDELEAREVEAQAEAERFEGLEEAANLPIETEIESVVAEVTSRELTDFDTTFKINRGSGDGIRVRMPVVTEAGLVGQVVRVEGGEAWVRPITDPDYPRFGVRLLESRDVGTAHAAEGGIIRIDGGIRLETGVEVGGEVVTSGIDGSTYPPDLLVGEVISRRPNADRTGQIVDVEPYADLDGLSYVAVLLCTDDCA
jgi:rod shape-determining protein MreC